MIAVWPKIAYVIGEVIIKNVFSFLSTCSLKLKKQIVRENFVRRMKVYVSVMWIKVTWINGNDQLSNKL